MVTLVHNRLHVQILRKSNHKRYKLWIIKSRNGKLRFYKSKVGLQFGDKVQERSSSKIEKKLGTKKQCQE